ncbi:class I SAM-dependent methyltransferase [Pelagicoccus sp. SDUM812003]|uniref:class I SAM-dependent methyltransferase n=1 Tax=Pelagicoccus sp. SDUM812003 TaxID=3041267 RepID=UPI00280DEC47|nr:class I SAM-dependent methyltransferase [Pelagicoccus sp. SDUM812003]MDQ8203387.1 class I SAM-dependent methyltransferase [Pelagicoccus sp. SDUM812003]
MDELNIDWEILARLRRRFLEQSAGSGVYWQDEQDLAHYHAFFAARIGWKWDDALRNAEQSGWSLRSRVLLDWGCGSGIATLRLLERYGAEAVDKVLLYDHSLLACRFAQKTISDAYPDLAVEIAPNPSQIEQLGETTVLLSHALNELTTETRTVLASQLKGAAQVFCVEAGDHATSRLLISLRESLRSTHAIAAPCLRCDACPMLQEENARHWCHFFGKPPLEAFTEGAWARFATLMEVDLRSLPYSFLVLDRSSLAPADASRSTLPDHASRLIGRPRQFKGYTRALSCDASGLRDLELQKRDDKALWKSLKKGKDGTLYRWVEIEAGRIKSGSPLD